MRVPTSLEEEIRRRITTVGSIPVAQYMSLCLTHPTQGYYITREPFGVAGDFTTAPEVSQMFGELIGLWSAAVWRKMASPENIRLIELGPGRGTMMRDMLRAMSVMPGFRDAVVVHLVEISPTLEKIQRKTLEDAGVPIFWHRSFADVPSGQCIIVANEFIDALPIHQAMKQEDGWYERVIELNPEGNFRLGLAKEPISRLERLLPPHIRESSIGSIYEWRSDSVALEIGRRVRDNGAALVIDYGHVESDVGDTLQSVGDHAFQDPLFEPGLTDITAHVDFQEFANAAESIGAQAHGPLTQGMFLRRLGIEARADKLKAKATGEKVYEIEQMLVRLTRGGRTGMGEMFKVMGLADPKLGVLPGFEPD